MRNLKNMNCAIELMYLQKQHFEALIQKVLMHMPNFKHVMNPIKVKWESKVLKVRHVFLNLAELGFHGLSLRSLASKLIPGISAENTHRSLNSVCKFSPVFCSICPTLLKTEVVG